MSKRKRVTPLWRISHAGGPRRIVTYEEARHDKRTLTLRRPDVMAEWRRYEPRAWMGRAG